MAERTLKICGLRLHGGGRGGGGGESGHHEAMAAKERQEVEHMVLRWFEDTYPGELAVFLPAAYVLPCVHHYHPKE